MKIKIAISLLVIILVGILLSYAYNNLGHTDNTFDMIFSSDKLTTAEKEWLKEKKFLTYSSDHDTPPLRYVDEKTGRYIGMVVDYMESLSLELGIEIKVQPEIWQVALDKLEIGEVDMVDMYPSDIRSKKYYFTNPIFYQNAIVVVRSDDESIKTTKDLAFKKVAAQTGDFVNEFMEREIESVKIVNTDDYRQAVKLLKEGKVDAVVGDESVIYYFLNFYDMTEDFHILENLLYENKFVLGIPKSEVELLGILNKGIKVLNRKDTLVKIQQKWFGISTPLSNPDTAGKFVIVVIFLIAVVIIGIFLFYSWNSELKSKVQERTQALQISENALQTTFDSLTHLMIVIDENGNIINANAAFYNRLDDKEKLIDESIYSIFNIKDILKSNSKSEIMYQGLFYEIRTHDLGGNEQAMIVMLEDITEKKINEKQLLSANKMAAIGQLAAGVAHEIRNPLGLIRNYAYLLKESKTLDDKLRDKSFEMIEKSVERASNIIDNLLNFSSISGMTLSTFNLYEFIFGIVELHRKLLSRNEIKVAIICSSDLQVTLNIESMKHIIINLISNAIDAIGTLGELTIHCIKSSDKLKIEIKDTGCGISEEKLQQIFNPFYTTKRPGEGTGLGLYIVYSEVEKLGGSISVFSKENIGTTFRITL